MALFLFVIVVYAFVVSWAQERNGYFQKMSPSRKQWFNAVLATIIPYLINLLTNGAILRILEELAVSQDVLVIVSGLIPGLIWVLTQIAHKLDAK
ncbi:MAG: hypothetical protein OEX12_11655 [Gammaproteobacteria bacterium]|nr:hypothetical protein [Gammaproteobacteria bacterium]